MPGADLSQASLPDTDYNRPRRKSRNMRHYMQRRSLRRRLGKVAFLAVVVAASLLAAYLLGRR